MGSWVRVQAMLLKDLPETRASAGDGPARTRHLRTPAAISRIRLLIKGIRKDSMSYRGLN